MGYSSSLLLGQGAGERLPCVLRDEWQPLAETGRFMQECAGIFCSGLLRLEKTIKPENCKGKHPSLNFARDGRFTCRLVANDLASPTRVVYTYE